LNNKSVIEMRSYLDSAVLCCEWRWFYLLF